jgi:hypothetical protein
MSKRHVIHTGLIVGTAYLMGSPALAAIRPAIVDQPLRSFHEEVGRAAAATAVTFVSLKGGLQAYIARIGPS